MDMPRRTYIAVIDDDESLCRSLARLLHQAGYQPVTFASAEDFLADPLRAHFECLLVDVQLGGMSGIELHKQLNMVGNRAPVIYITAFDDPRAKAEATQAGSAGFFRKTDDGLEILSAIRHAVAAAPPG
jgi:FixJ family two-component response regulator